MLMREVAVPDTEGQAEKHQGGTMVKFLCAVPKVLSESEDDKLQPPSPVDSSKELGHVGCVE